jgi:hypothetical protein
MKVFIEITGKPTGNRILLNAISTHESVITILHFGQFSILFPNYVTAIKALQDAFETLKNDEPDFKRIELMLHQNILIYDASMAKIN